MVLELRTSFLATLKIFVAAPVEIGSTVDGIRRIIPITGGTVDGPGLTGKVLAGGADFQLLKSDTLTELEAKYAIETDSGERIYVDNIGLRSGSQQDIARLVRGEAVNPKRIYFRCTPRLHSSAEKWSWLSSRIFIGSGERYKDAVHIDLFVVD
ncbi:DUF3237 domain-containing protein [Paenarthrobacter sp. NPDC057981]|uniref:DUF3237 domain-containing protein n=1 Tax=Paenarthrobacter sp. NPDC057981 TaxID=3346297 RepID=UPI0036DD72BC